MSANCYNPKCYRPGNPFCYVCLCSLTPAQRKELAAAQDDEVEHMALSIVFGLLLGRK